VQVRASLQWKPKVLSAEEVEATARAQRAKAKAREATKDWARLTATVGRRGAAGPTAQRLRNRAAALRRRLTARCLAAGDLCAEAKADGRPAEAGAKEPAALRRRTRRAAA
jgi:hypothetical protein